MNIEHMKAVIGTNSWGSRLYGRLLRGSAVSEETLRETVGTAVKADLLMFDTAQDYGLGKGQKLIGALCPAETMISAKYTPGRRYQSGQVRRSLEKDLRDFGRDSVEVYWLHLPNCIKKNLTEMAALYCEGKIRHIGVSNFDLNECKAAQRILSRFGIPLYGVQNHYSLLARDWEQNGLTAWCRENGVSFWAWAVLEEGMLVSPKRDESRSVMKMIFRKKRERLVPLYRKMKEIGAKHHLTIPQVATAFVASKGFVPICGCRKPYQVTQLQAAAGTQLSAAEIAELEQAADAVQIKILGADMFRFAVKK